MARHKKVERKKELDRKRRRKRKNKKLHAKGFVKTQESRSSES